MNTTRFGKPLEDAVWISGDTEAAELNMSDVLASGLGVLLPDGHCDLDTVLAAQRMVPGCSVWLAL
jgi:hypothetical protein